MPHITGLSFSSDHEPGIRRLERGKGFVYLKPNGRPVRSPVELKRIRALAIPPAYRDVWICMNSRGHLQATGRDARGRKQYRYHPRWRETRDCAKFEHIPAPAAPDSSYDCLFSPSALNASRWRPRYTASA